MSDIIIIDCRNSDATSQKNLQLIFVDRGIYWNSDTNEEGKIKDLKNCYNIIVDNNKIYEGNVGIMSYIKSHNISVREYGSITEYLRLDKLKRIKNNIK